MPGPKPLQIELSDEEQAYLQSVVRKRTAPKRDVDRALAILLAAQGESNAAIADRLGCDVRTVRVWRRRFRGEGRAGLRDRPRPGRPRGFSP